MTKQTASQDTDPRRGRARGDIGRRIARRREELGLSREETAHRAGTAPGYLEYLEERPSAAPGSGVLLRIANALETTVSALHGGETDLPPGTGRASAHARMRELSDEECRELLSTHGVGRLLTATPDGPAITPVNYSVVDDAIVFRTALGTGPADVVNQDTAFEVDRIDDALSQGWSVLVRGVAREVTDAEQVRRLEETAYSRPWPQGRRDVWVCLVPRLLTGRRIDTP
ncbi:pyridoxamine 5'-phosphate oxidase family protein [Streptomyces sp. TRM70308]|uniref:helix-turn-helix domain-containing protein n=1 Tax=Streptomyces TaxID=1883 RepID=UPI002248E5D7|nr:pyridoxamine 5'-phosphate oxidase family protein [Streptomyces sp. JHD 1]MCX2971378.1 pyridoxamine 5'-phosphate oxidase family protein [Streptomyces sp. JHD 1]